MQDQDTFQPPTIAPMPGSALPVKTSDAVAIAQNRDRDRLIWASKQPRDEEKVLQSIIQSCRRPSFAAIAIWEKKIGGKMEKGPSVRLAEVIAQKWSNFEIGYQIIPEASNDKQTTVKVFAWDLETNYCIAPEITIQHKHPGKDKPYLTAVDDVYKVVAAAISKKQRDCIFKVVPRDIVDLAYEECQKTLADVKDLGPTIERLKFTFSDVGVTVEHLENYIGKKIKDFTGQDVSELRAVFSCFKNGEMHPDEIKNFKQREEEAPAEKKAAPKGKQKDAPAQAAPPATPETAGTATTAAPSEQITDVQAEPIDAAQAAAEGIFE